MLEEGNRKEHNGQHSLLLPLSLSLFRITVYSFSNYNNKCVIEYIIGPLT